MDFELDNKVCWDVADQYLDASVFLSGTDRYNWSSPANTGRHGFTLVGALITAVIIGFI